MYNILQFSKNGTFLCSEAIIGDTGTGCRKTVRSHSKRDGHVKYILHKVDPKKLWKLFAANNIHNKPINDIPPELQDVDRINECFSHSIEYPDIQEDIINKFISSKKEGIDAELIFYSVTTKEVQSLVNKIKTNVTGIDGINLKMLKIVLLFCLNALTVILNNSIENGVVPTPPINKA